MKKALFIYSVALVATTMISANAQTMPHYDITAHCNAEQWPAGNTNTARCEFVERTMRDVIMLGWNEYTPAVRKACIERAMEDKQPPSYQTLNACLAGGNP